MIDVRLNLFVFSSPEVIIGKLYIYHPLKGLNYMADRWYAIINPQAGSGKGKTDWPQIESLLKLNGIDFDYVFTTHKYHSVELTVNAINLGYKKLIAIGGDGTLNEIVNGVFIQKRYPTTEIA